MSIQALVKGSANILREQLGDILDVGERLTDGAPHGAYKRPKGWFVGVYFGGFNAVSHTNVTLTYTLGVDITRVIPAVPSGKRGEWMLKDGELWDMAGRVTEVLLSAAGKVAVACNAALEGSWQSGKGVFREQFHTANCGKARPESPEWIMGVPSERQPDEPILVLPLTVTGLKWKKELGNLYVKGAENG